MRKLFLAGLMVATFAGVALAGPNVDVFKLDGDKPVLDGVIDDAAYIAAALNDSRMVIDMQYDRAKLQDQRGISYLTYDDANLYIGTINYVSDAKAIDLSESTWGGADGMEVCFMNKDEAIISLIGYPGGTSVVTVPSGEFADVETPFGYKATVGANYWASEYVIPFKAFNIDVKKPIGVNIGAFKKGEGVWEAWIGANGANWQVFEAGTITLK